MRSQFIVCMNKKNLSLVAIALILGAVYVFKFTDWFAEKNIQILYRSRNSQPFFGLENKEYNLTLIKVVKVDEFSTNKYALPVWHLVSEDPVKGAAPIADFVYGQTLAGMKPAIPGTAPATLNKNTGYRIFVESGKLKGERDFDLK